MTRSRCSQPTHAHAPSEGLPGQQTEAATSGHGQLSLSRRGMLLATAAAAMAGAATAAEPIERSLPPRFQLGLAAYGFRRFFPWMKGKPQQPADE